LNELIKKENDKLKNINYNEILDKCSSEEFQKL